MVQFLIPKIPSHYALVDAAHVEMAGLAAF
jgi:hypothetical protein